MLLLLLRPPLRYSARAANLERVVEAVLATLSSFDGMSSTAIASMALKEAASKSPELARPPPPSAASASAAGRSASQPAPQPAPQPAAAESGWET